MKSILVDALRQSQGKDSHSTLSDSGSFDTTQTEFGPTANDEDVIVYDGPAEELELQQTGVFHQTSLMEQSGVFTSEEMDSLVDDPAALHPAIHSPDTVRRAVPATPNSTTVPTIARLAPLLCAGLAISAAMAWAGYRHFAAIDTSQGVGVSQSYSGVAGNNGEVENTVRINGAERFPFIDAGAEVHAGDSSE